jgi:hypothetical protein
MLSICGQDDLVQLVFAAKEILVSLESFSPAIIRISISEANEKYEL